jgi:hypothetical protein
MERSFEFVFTLFGLVLGLSLTEVVTGFARVLKTRKIIHLGWLTSLLALFVMLDLVSFWSAAWAGRAYLQLHYGTMVLGLVVCGSYYLAASLIFPTEFGDRAAFDAHYFGHRRQVLGAVLVCNLVGTLWIPLLIYRSNMKPADWVLVALYYVLLVVGLSVAGKKTSVAVLSALILLYLVEALSSIMLPLLA